jgi:hypothetical protein
MKRRRAVFKTVVAPIIVAVALIPTLAIAVLKVLHGRGAAVYTNVFGLAINYTSVLIMVAAVILVLGAAYLARIVHLWRYGEATELREVQSQTPFTDPGDSK